MNLENNTNMYICMLHAHIYHTYNTYMWGQVSATTAPPQTLRRLRLTTTASPAHTYNTYMYLSCLILYLWRASNPVRRSRSVKIKTTNFIKNGIKYDEKGKRHNRNEKTK